MNKNLAQIEFYFPEGEFKNRSELVNSIIYLIKEKANLEYSGFADINLLKQGLLNHIGFGNPEEYKEISKKQKLEIGKIISETIEKCNKKLPIPTKNFIFVHPFLSTKDDVVFEGVMAVAMYSCVFHLFINLHEYSRKSLENTVAHELNHTIFYFNHFSDFNNYILLDEILLEGLAENFREQFFDPKISEWAGALSKSEAFKALKESKEILKSRNKRVIKEFLFGNDRYKIWTGYSVGYWLVKEFIDNNLELSWDDLMKIESEKFISNL